MELKKTITPLFVFEYGVELTNYVTKARSTKGFRQEQLRALSSGIVTPDDINAVDDLLLRQVLTNRTKAHVIIASHAVTKEAYGYRVTSFRLNQISALAPTLVVCLYTDAATTRSRIRNDAGGRPRVSAFEANFHTFLQSNIAVMYAIQAGVPLYFLDSAKPRESLVQWFRARLS